MDSKLSNAPPELLLRKVAAHDEAALEQLYDQFSSRLYGVLVRILGNDSIAEEALQDVFVRIWTKAGDYQRDRGSAITWMTSISRYHAYDLIRRRKAREYHETEFDEDVHSLGTNRDIDLSMAISNEGILNLCLERLDIPTKECILGAYVSGYTREELSDTKAKPLGTIKSWIRRGLIKLKECINEHS